MEFVQIEGYENYEINRNGVVYNIDNFKKVSSFENNNYKKINLRNNNESSLILLHRLIATAFIPKIEGRPFVDHINNNSLDNRIENLRWCTARENSQNAKLSKRNTLGYKGISYHKRDKCFFAKICFNRKQIFIGTYKTLDEARIARQHKAHELFGNFTNSCEKL